MVGAAVNENGRGGGGGGGGGGGITGDEDAEDEMPQLTVTTVCSQSTK
jgi:hypothetical protein